MPARLRKALGFSTGESLVARVVDGCLIIEKTDSVERRLRARFRKVKNVSLADELVADRRAEAEHGSES